MGEGVGGGGLRSHAIDGNQLHCNWFKGLRLKLETFTFIHF